jgi:hypothetical protein
MTCWCIVCDRKATKWGTLDARKIRDEDRCEKVAENLASQTIWAVAVWKSLAFLAFGTPFGYLERIIYVVCSPPSNPPYVACS